jgi:hypothetical protein
VPPVSCASADRAFDLCAGEFATDSSVAKDFFWRRPGAAKFGGAKKLSRDVSKKKTPFCFPESRSFQSLKGFKPKKNLGRPPDVLAL